MADLNIAKVTGLVQTSRQGLGSRRVKRLHRRVSETLEHIGYAHACKHAKIRFWPN